MDSNPISVTIIEACKLSGISRSYLYQVMARGDVGSVKAGRRRLVLVASLRSWLQSLSPAPLAMPPGVTNRSSASRFMAPLIFDNDLFWSGCSDDAAFFAKNMRRMFRLRNSFEGEWSEFGGIFRSVLVIRLWSRGFRLRIALFDVTHSNCPAWNEPVSDIGVSEELTAELHHNVESAKPSSTSDELA